MSSGCDLDVQIGFSSSFCPENKSSLRARAKQTASIRSESRALSGPNRQGGGQVIQGVEIVGKLEQFAKMSQVPPIILPVCAENYSSETGSGS